MMPGSAAVEALAGLQELARRAEASAIARDTHLLLERVREGRFFVACLGQFKRGKSTLINALLGEDVLPSGVAPVTSVATVVRHGEKRARVRLGSDEWREIAAEEIVDYVSESANPENRKGVTGVEVYCPSPFLERGLCLVDTPGIGSVFAGNTAETRAFLPQIDVAIVVLGGDPPISGEELELVGSIASRVREILLVLNKSDRLSDDERKQARAFTETVIAERVPAAAGAIFEVSALEQLRGGGPPRDWPALLARIEMLAQRSGVELVERAAIRGFESLAARLRRHFIEEREALLRPAEQSEQRLHELRRCAADAQQGLLELRHLFDAEQAKLAQRFDEDKVRFVERALLLVIRELDECLSRSPVRRGPKLRRFALEQAQVVTESFVAAWMAERTPIAEREFAAVTERFVAHANEFLSTLRDSGQVPPDALPAALAPATGLRARSRYYFLSEIQPSPLWLVAWLADLVRTERFARAAVTRAAHERAAWLLQLNAGRVAGDFAERVLESRRSVESALRCGLEEIATTAEQAALRTRAVREQGAEAVKSALAGLERNLAELITLEELATAPLQPSKEPTANARAMSDRTQQPEGR